MESRFEESILVSLRRIVRSIDLYSRSLARTHRLTGPQLIVLLEVAKSGHSTPSAIARAVSLSQATVTGILDRLEKRSLVRRSRSDRDKRLVEITLTDAGQALIENAPSPLADQFRSRLASLPEGEQAMIDWMLGRVVEMMEAEDVDAAPVLATGPLEVKVDEVRAYLTPDAETPNDDN